MRWAWEVLAAGSVCAAIHEERQRWELLWHRARVAEGERRLLPISEVLLVPGGSRGGVGSRLPQLQTGTMRRNSYVSRSRVAAGKQEGLHSLQSGRFGYVAVPASSGSCGARIASTRSQSQRHCRRRELWARARACLPAFQSSLTRAAPVIDCHKIILPPGPLHAA